MCVSVCFSEMHCVAGMVKSVCVGLQMKSNERYTLVSVFLQIHSSIQWKIPVS